MYGLCGRSKSTRIPVLVVGRKMVVTDKEKADLLGKTFARVHSGVTLDEVQYQSKVWTYLLIQGVFFILTLFYIVE
jgi:hypothetical protein